jgi:hypothetical protein
MKIDPRKTPRQFVRPDADAIPGLCGVAVEKPRISIKFSSSGARYSASS